MIKNKKILILGGAGFICSALIKALYSDNEITVVDKCDFEKSSFGLSGLNKINSIKKINLDATDYESIMKLGNDFDYIIHAVAILGINKVVQNSILTINTNFLSCKNALELAKNQKNLKKFLSFSTSEVYGQNVSFADEKSDLSIGPPNEGRWCYAASKTLSEHLITAYSREFNIPTLIIRPFNVFGENRTGSNAMSTFIFKALKNESITIEGTGNQIRTWCYIDDFIDGVIKSLKSDIKNEIFNIGNPNNSISILNLAQMIKKITKSNSSIVLSGAFVPDVHHRTLSIDKAKLMLNFNPTITLEEGIKRTCNGINNYIFN